MFFCLNPADIVRLLAQRVPRVAPRHHGVAVLKRGINQAPGILFLQQAHRQGHGQALRRRNAAARLDLARPDHIVATQIGARQHPGVITGLPVPPRECVDRHRRVPVTDVRHIAQLLDRVAADEYLGPAALTRWFEERMRDPRTGSTDRSRRLDSDAAAVQILTVHGSKGLEFPVVYVPFGWDSAKHPNPDPLLLHEDGRRILDVGGEGSPGYGQRRARHDEEAAGEELRLLYVALTRATQRLIVVHSADVPEVLAALA